MRMEEARSWFSFLRTSPGAILSILMLCQCAAFYGVPKEREVNLARPLAAIPSSLGTWRMVREIPIDARVLDVLKADDTVERVYTDTVSGRSVTFYMAFFRSQSTGVSPHSPKNCLPGSGWVASQTGSLDLSVPGFASPVSVNRYIVRRGDARSVVLYWYQSYNRIIPNEYWAKAWLVLDSIRYRRSDTSIVRVTAPVLEENDAAAQAAAVAFVQASLKTINDMLPR
jgi:EpsI family protein